MKTALSLCFDRRTCGKVSAEFRDQSLGGSLRTPELKKRSMASSAGRMSIARSLSHASSSNVLRYRSPSCTGESNHRAPFASIRHVRQRFSRQPRGWCRSRARTTSANPTGRASRAEECGSGPGSIRSTTVGDEGGLERGRPMPSISEPARRSATASPRAVVGEGRRSPRDRRGKPVS